MPNDFSVDDASSQYHLDIAVVKNMKKFLKSPLIEADEDIRYAR
jgi:hypothetical protein